MEMSRMADDFRLRIGLAITLSPALSSPPFTSIVAAEGSGKDIDVDFGREEEVGGGGAGGPSEGGGRGLVGGVERGAWDVEGRSSWGGGGKRVVEGRAGVVRVEDASVAGV